MALPNPGMSFSPLTELPAAELNDIVENVEALSAGTGLATGAVTTAKLADASVTPAKLATGATTASVATNQTTSSSSFTDLATVGPAATVTIGANGMALVLIQASQSVSGVFFGRMGFAVSGATTIAASSASATNCSITNTISQTWVALVTGLTPGSNTFTAKYQNSAGSGTANFSDRRISVVPL